jgi:nitrate/TMAO reductase-like tetraheme cytochrome c subunit
MIVFLFVITSLLDQGASYIGLVIFILLPAIMIVGLLLIPLGMILQIRKMREGEDISEKEWPKIDLNDIRHRNAALIFSVGTTIFLFLSALGSYEAFHYTESVDFCGTVCHSVMEPEYTAYQNSPHARVACVDCHVGSGADWYVRSKLSGLYQVYAVIMDVYPRPIATPIRNLRPARETCEQCHWPEKFYSQKLRTERHYLNDEENTPWDIHLIMKIGGEYSALGFKEGIHWHINPDVRIEYISTDEPNLEIPWVQYTDVKTGERVVYTDEDNPLEEETLKQSRILTMDCMDCHNRPSHSYRPPAFFVNDAITADMIPSQLPEIKSLAMEICDVNFSTTDSAMQYIRNAIFEFYAENYEDIFEDKKDLIEKAVEGLQSIYSENIFPGMKVRWDAYPNHIGHLEFDGCFRCHNDRHTSEIGQTISKDCQLCHTIGAQGSPDEMQIASLGQSLTFVHPADVGDDWKDELCTECHTGLNP